LGRTKIAECPDHSAGFPALERPTLANAWFGILIGSAGFHEKSRARKNQADVPRQVRVVEAFRFEFFLRPGSQKWADDEYGKLRVRSGQGVRQELDVLRLELLSGLYEKPAGIGFRSSYAQNGVDDCSRR
jgi:hypothetical protein